MSARPPAPRIAVPPLRAPSRTLDLPLAGAWAMAAAWAAVFSWLAIRRHEGFWTGRFDLGNMVQAVWSTTQGRPLETTDVLGRQFVRLGAHVDPVLVLFAPLWSIWPAPEMLLVAQAVGLALGAIPVFWLGRRWLADDRLALAAAAVYLLYPPVQWLTVTEFHPVAFATPLLLFCIWAIEEDRPIVLAVCAPLAALTKEQVGLAIAMLGVWAAVVHGRRLLGALLALGGAGWTAFCITVVIPYYGPGDGGSPFVGRYRALGEDEGDVVRTVLTRPWDAVEVLWAADRLDYLLALLLPLLLLPFAAPLLAAGALPDLLLNMLAGYWPQYSVEFQYTAVVIPFLVAASVRGLATVRRWERPAPLAALLARPPVVAALMLGAVLVSCWRLGPLPFWQHVPGGSDFRATEFDVSPRTGAMAAAVALVPDGVPVSAGNLLASRLSARERMYTFPVIADAAWVLVDERRPYFADRVVVGPAHRRAVEDLRRDPRFRLVFARDGVLAFQRRPAAGRPGR